MTEPLIICIAVLCFIVLFCLIFNMYELKRNKRLVAEINEIRQMMCAVYDRSDVNYWECDFEKFEKDIIEIEKRLFVDDDKNIEVLDDDVDLTEELEELEEVSSEEEFEKLKKDNQSCVNFDIQSYNSIFGGIDPLIIQKEYREQYIQLLKDFGEGKTKPVVDIKIPIEIANQNDRVQTENWKRIIYEVIKKDQGKVTKALALVMDITTQERNEREYENTIKYSFTQQQYPLYTRLNLTTNKVRERAPTLPDFADGMRGQTATQILKYLLKLVQNDNQNSGFVLSIENLIAKFRDDGTRNLQCPFYYRFSNGERHWFELCIKLISNPKTGEIEAFCNLTDTTNQVISLSTKDEVLNGSVEYIFWLNKVSGVCTFITKSSAVDWVKDSKTVKYDDFISIFLKNKIKDLDKEKVKELFDLKRIEEILKNKDDVNFSYHSRKEDGSVEIKQQQIYCYNSEPNILIFVCTDVTAIALMESENNEKLALATKQAELANAAKSDFLSRMSHDLRTPMNGVIGIAQLAKKELDDPVALERDIDKIHSSSVYMVSLLNDILDMSKIESGKMEIRPTKTNVGKMLETIITLAQIMCDDKGISFYCNLNYEKYKNAYLFIDEIHSKQIIMNLISNASKFTPRGGRIEFILEANHLPENKMEVVFVLRDTGCGMSKEFQKTMYEAFTQDSNSVNKVGTGLGLTIVYSLVQLMGGSIDCKSDIGEGTEFTVKAVVEDIKYDEVKDCDEKTIVTKYEDIKNFDLNDKRALVVEDNELNQEIASRLLMAEGMKVEIANNGLEALNMFSDNDYYYYDVILMDVMMPVMDGLKAAKLLRGMQRKDAESVPIIAMTANAFVEDIEKCKESGMDRHIAKPIEKDKMFEAIKECLVFSGGGYKKYV